jgi:hypothetical protein
MWIWNWTWDPSPWILPASVKAHLKNISENGMLRRFCLFLPLTSLLFLILFFISIYLSLSPHYFRTRTVYTKLNIHDILGGSQGKHTRQGQCSNHAPLNALLGELINCMWIWLVNVCIPRPGSSNQSLCIPRQGSSNQSLSILHVIQCQLRESHKPYLVYSTGSGPIGSNPSSPIN